jgi:hypothetical protein
MFKQVSAMAAFNMTQDQRHLLILHLAAPEHFIRGSFVLSE